MSVRHLVASAREARVLVGVVAALVGAAAVATAILLPTTYTSRATFYVTSPQATASPSDSYQGAQLASERIASYVELLTGRRVAQDASVLLGGSPPAEEVQDAVSVDSVSSTVVLDLAVTARSPQEAHDVAAAVGEAFSGLVRGLESARQPDGRPIVVAAVLVPPGLPGRADGPPRVLLVVLGLLAGPLAGVAALLLRPRLRRRVEGVVHVEDALGAPVLGRIPARRPGSGHLAVLAAPSTARTDRRARHLRERTLAFGLLRTAFRSVAGGPALVVAGVGDEREASTFAVELAVVLAADGESVVVVDADLRAPAVHRLAGLDVEPGLADVLRGEVGLHTALRSWPLAGVDVLPAGSATARPNELLAGIGPVLQVLGRRYRRVIVTSASATAAADAADLASHGGEVLLVVRRRVARPEEVRTTRAEMDLLGVRVLGAMLVDALDAPEHSETREPTHPPTAPTRGPWTGPPRGPSPGGALVLRTASSRRSPATAPRGLPLSLPPGPTRSRGPDGVGGGPDGGPRGLPRTSPAGVVSGPPDRTGRS